MCLREQDFGTVPAETAKLAHQVFPKGNPYLTLRDHLGMLYTDARFAALFSSSRGRPAESPACLALAVVIEYMEDLSDTEVAEQIRARIDLKYFLGLELTDTGFDASVLTEFRERLVAQELVGVLLQAVLQKAESLQLLKKRGRQRSDSTHVLGAVAQLNRLELVGETLRAALEALAVAAPDWLRTVAPASWYERYGHRFVHGRQPRQARERDALAQQIAADGAELLAACHAEIAPTWLVEMPAVRTLQHIWEQQYSCEDGQWRWRTPEEQPAHTELQVSPYDPDVRYSRKRETEWCGYKVHLSESCETYLPRLITNVETGNAAAPDGAMTATIHKHLAAQDLLPREHLMDGGYLDAQVLVTESTTHAVRLVGPVPSDPSWQARAAEGYDLACFAIDWEAQQVTCPQGRVSTQWRGWTDEHDQPAIQVCFARSDCSACPVRQQCTRSAARTLSFRPRAQHEALQQRRQEQKTPEFQADYQARAGAEGTISQAVRRCGLRRARYIGQAKTHLQNVATAAALNLSRLADWFSEIQPRKTRTSHFVVLQPI